MSRVSFVRFDIYKFCQIFMTFLWTLGIIELKRFIWYPAVEFTQSKIIRNFSYETSIASAVTFFRQSFELFTHIFLYLRKAKTGKFCLTLLSVPVRWTLKNNLPPQNDILAESRKTIKLLKKNIECYFCLIRTFFVLLFYFGKA